MHTIHESSLFPCVDLTFVKTDKFKTGCFMINLVVGLERETAASTALLPRVLRRGSKDFPDIELLAAALDDLYGARIEPVVRKKGELHCIGFYVDYPDGRYIPGGINILENVASLVGGILLSPAMDGGLLRADYVESEKKTLIDDIRATINDKRVYAIDRLVQTMCANEAFGTHRLGTESEAAAITPRSLTEHYHRLISNSTVEVLYCGSDDVERVESALREALQKLPERKNTNVPKTEIILYPPHSPPAKVIEQLDVTQGKLAIGFRLGKAMKGDIDFPAMMVFNAVYGSGVTSKLFANVREKLALCYYAGSILDKHKGVMVVSSGVEFANFDVALDEILAQLSHVKAGDISEEELLSAKLSIVTSIKSTMDRPGGLLELYFDSSIASTRYDPEELCAMVESVTPARVTEIASEIETDTIYRLTGV